MSTPNHAATQWDYHPDENNTNTVDGNVNYRPGPFLLDSNAFGWTSLSNYIVSLPPDMDGYNPCPPKNFYIIDMVCSGQVDAEYKIDSGPWTKLLNKANRIGIYAPQHGISWRWRPLCEQSAPLLLSCVYMRSSFLAKTAVETLDIEPSKVKLLSQVQSSDTFLQEQLTSMKDELECGNPFGPIYADITAQVIAIHLLKHYCHIDVLNRLNRTKRTTSLQKINTVIDYINSNLCNEIKLQTLSGLIGVSEYHFLRIFRDQIGQSPLQYIISKRIDRAKLLMQRTHLSMTEIAMDVGYNNISHFINVFKRTVGITPAKYKKLIRE